MITCCLSHGKAYIFYSHFHHIKVNHSILELNFVTTLIKQSHWYIIVAASAIKQFHQPSASWLNHWLDIIEGDKKTYEKTSPPQPKRRVSNRGEKSRAGLIGAPQLNPKANAIRAKSTTPIAKGIKPLGQFMFRSSVIAWIMSKKNDTATTW